MKNATSDAEIRPVIVQNRGEHFQMTRRPNVVVAEISDVRSTRRHNPRIARGRLQAGVLGKTHPTNLSTERLFDHLFGTVLATIANAMISNGACL